jgi:hypothetical protein
MIKYIGVAGKARSGKNTYADLTKVYLEQNYSCMVEIKAFADYLKQKCAEMTGFPLDYFYGLAPERGDEIKEILRPLMITVGDLYKEPLLGGWQTYWVENMTKECTYPTEDLGILSHKVIIVPDVRYDFEAQWIIDNGGVIVQMIGTDPILNTISTVAQQHSSEQGIPENLVDWFIHNDRSSGLDMLERISKTSWDATATKLGLARKESHCL